MQRRKFLAISMAAASPFAAQAEPDSYATDSKPFTVKAGDARFGIHTPFRGINGNDVKVG